MWTKEEQERLRELKLNPKIHTREQLRQLFQHFENGGSLKSVHEDGVPVKKARNTARKIYEAFEQSKLDWVLPKSANEIVNVFTVSMPDDAAVEHEEVRWIAERLREQVKLPLARVLADSEFGSAPERHWASLGWTPEPSSALGRNWAFSVDRSTVPPAVSLVSEFCPAFPSLRNHLPVSPLWHHLDQWKRHISLATSQAACLEKDLRQDPALLGVPCIEPEDFRAANDGITTGFIPTVLSELCRSQLNQEPLRSPEECYEIETVAQGNNNDQIFQLMICTSSRIRSVIAKSPCESWVRGMMMTHWRLRTEMAEAKKTTGMVRHFREAVAYQSSIEHLLDEAIATIPFPGECESCRRIH